MKQIKWIKQERIEQFFFSPNARSLIATIYRQLTCDGLAH